MKILHTSDWHIGRNLYTKKRYEEFTLFLDWLTTTIIDEHIEVLLVAGDIFDTTLPSHRSQELYYKFLSTIASTSSCHSVVIIGGNHDSPSFLDAPRELLHSLHVYVVGSVREDIEEEVITLYSDDIPQAIICAVPYLRDKDVRTSESGETIEDKNNKLILGIKEHYERVCTIAERIQHEINKTYHLHIPIIAMGHLFSAGGKVSTGDGVRDLYVGSLGYVNEYIFPSCIDYLALGHLHSAQNVGSKGHFRYSGSPLPMGFGEANEQKNVLIITFIDNHPSVKELTIPIFQQLETLSGTLEEIQKKINNLIEEGSHAWLEIELSNTINAREDKLTLEEMIANSSLTIVRTKDTQLVDSILHSSYKNETLDDIDEFEVFNRLLSSSGVSDEEREELILSYKEIVLNIQHQDLLEE